MATFFMKGANVNPYTGQTGTMAAPGAGPVQRRPGEDETTRKWRDERCEEHCYDRYHNMLADANVDNAEANNYLQICLQRCIDIPGGEEEPPETGCPGGYKAKMAGGGQLVPCQQGYESRNINGVQWCCPTDTIDEEDVPCADGYENIYYPEPCREGYEEKLNKYGAKWCCPSDVEPPEGECTCEGGRKISEVGYSGGQGGGAIWQDPNNIIPAKYIRSGNWEGHAVWDAETQKYYYTHELQDYYQGKTGMPAGMDAVCPKGWTREGDCCCPGGEEGTEEGTLGEFKYPGELMDLWDLLAGRGREILTKEPGYSQAAMDQMFGKEFENIRSLGKATREQQLADLQSAGLLGTGAAADVGRETAWSSEQKVGDVIRDLFILNEEKKKQDLLDYTSAGRDIIGAGRGLFGDIESFNLGRRNESLARLALMLQYLQGLMSSWGQ